MLNGIVLLLRVEALLAAVEAADKEENLLVVAGHGLIR